MNRHHLRLLLFAAAGALTAAGCVNEQRQHHDPDVTLAFEPVMHTLSHAVGSGSPTSEGSAAQSFGVSVWQLAGDETWDGNTDSAPYLAAARLVSDGRFWYPESGDNWPADRFTLTCIGFAPYEAATSCDAVQGVVFEGIDTTDDPGELRYTAPQTGLSKRTNGGVIILPMQPALCEVGFRVRAQAGYGGTVIIRSVSLDGLGIRGDFRSLPEPQWTIGKEAFGMRFFEGEVTSDYTVRYLGTTRRVIPQELACGVTVEYDLLTPDGIRISQTHTTEPIVRTLLAGYRYLFTLATGPDGVEVVPDNPIQNDEP